MKDFNILEFSFTDTEKHIMVLIWAVILIILSLPITKGIEIPVKIFIFVWVAAATLLVILFRRMFESLYNVNMPLNYKETRKKYDNPVYVFKTRLNKIGKIYFRGGYSVKIEMFENSILLSHAGRCLEIQNFENIKLKRELLYNAIEITKDESYIRCFINNKNFQKVENYIKEKISCQKQQ